MNQRLSAGTIEVQANVCSVKFHPESPHYLAFGAAGAQLLPLHSAIAPRSSHFQRYILVLLGTNTDHQIYYYDARTLREPLFVLRGHDKAVSHIQFLDSQRLVSAYTCTFFTPFWSSRV
jgi:E3 ubiquitin-protein ligase RFWD2